MRAIAIAALSLWVFHMANRGAAKPVEVAVVSAPSEKVEAIVRSLHDDWTNCPCTVKTDADSYCNATCGWTGGLRAAIRAALEMAAEVPWQVRHCDGTKELRDDIEEAIRALLKERP